MQWFRNMKIQVKLLTCFALLALCTGVVGFIGILNMGTLNNRADDMYKTNFVPAQYLATTNKHLQLVQKNYTMMILEQDATTFQMRLEQIQGWVQENNMLFERLDQKIHSPEERALFDTLKHNLAQYRAARDESINLMRAGQYQKAMALRGSVDKASDAVDDSMGALIRINLQQAEDKVRANAVEYTRQSRLMIIIAALGILVSVGLGLVNASMISKPLRHLVTAADMMAEGNLEVDIKVASRDEVGVLASAFKTMADHVNEVMANIATAAEQVASGARQVSDSSIALAQGATEQASSIEQLTASLEEISSQTTQNATNATEAKDLAGSARSHAVLGNAEMQSMLKAMEEINESSASISKIIKVIDEIAFQTNILALNAAVEAARAGQHGKGFAVVAEEVRNLAARSANAAKETTALIEGSVKKVEGGTRIAKQTADALHRIVDVTTRAANLVSEIATASAEQAVGIKQVNQGIMQVSNVVQSNSAASEESAAASEELWSQAEMLRTQVSRFKLRGASSSGSHSTSDYANVFKVYPPPTRASSYAEAAATKPKKISLTGRDFGKH